MLIALLAWGSLLWKPEPVKLKTPWKADGPLLPIEFARESDGGELAVVLCPGAPAVAVFWTVMEEVVLEKACEQLCVREGIALSRADGVGCVVRGQPHAQAFCAETIQQWQKSKGLDAVIWTALPPRSAGLEGRAPTAREAVSYLRRLHGKTRDHAKEYVRNVPPVVDTPTRSEIATRLGWLPR